MWIFIISNKMKTNPNNNILLLKKFQTNKIRIYRKFSMYIIHIDINQND